MDHPASPVKKVPTRRIAFGESLGDLPRHFAFDGDLISSHLICALSSVFPDGEDYFVRSVRHYRDQIDDPELKRLVAGFIGQESVHGREHRVLNDKLAELGYPAKHFEKATRLGIGVRERVFPAISNLAATAALEHFTATLAELVLSDEETRNQFGHAEVRNIFTWHALEESEHKAVAFDVYRFVGGSERLRKFTMNVMTAVFIVAISSMTIISMLGDRATYNPKKLWKSLRALRSSSFMSTKTWRQLRAYNRKGFHPDDRDTTALVEHWRRELFGEHGTLNDKLATAA